MSTVIPIRNGSTLTAKAITRTVTNIGNSGLAEYLASQLPESDSESVSESGEAESVAAPEPSSEPVAAAEPS